MKSWLTIVVRILTFLVFLFTIIPFITSKAWYVRIFDFPKIQVLFISVILFSLLIYHYIKKKRGAVALVILTFIIAYHVYVLVPFTPLSSTQAKSWNSALPDNQIKIIVANVYMHNKTYPEFIDVIEKQAPDLFLTLESDLPWEHALDSVEHQYPYTIKIPKDNTYGMHLYSKYPLVQADIKYWLDKDIPSIRTLIVMPAGDIIEFFGVHPKPPVPNEDDNSKRRDAEIIIVANRVSKSKYPVIVAGDFNDVAWSETTNLFRKSSGLLDPRIGRAFLNTYHAQIPFIKWPLDHVFFSPHFTLVNLDKLPAINSDHYPISIKLSLSAKDTEHFPVKKDSVTQKKETETIEEGIKDAKENN